MSRSSQLVPLLFSGVALALASSPRCAVADGTAPGVVSGGAISSPLPPTGEWTRLNINAPQTSVPPKIDGDLTDEAWKSAYRAVGFYRFGGSAPVVEQTEAWIIADGNALYIAFHCLDHQPQLIRASETQRGGDLENDDHVTVSLDSQGTRREFSSFLVSAIGTQQDFRAGGTADNISWAGDWKAATKRVADGWTAEICIPFRLLRYPKGCKSFGVLLQRRLGRESTAQVLAYVPADAQMWEKRAQYMHDLTGIAPPTYAPRPTLLPFTLIAAGDDGTTKIGMDIKYPITTTLTGVGTLFPDFRTIEQAVADINFSYNEQFVEDRRPFFAEGSDYFPDPFLFYSRRIDTVDEGLKLVGHNGRTTIGVVSAANQQAGKQRQSFILNLSQDIGLLHKVGVNVVADDRKGRSNNRVERLYGQYGIERGGVRYSLNASGTRSQLNASPSGSSENINLRFTSRPGRLNGRIGYNTVSPDFVSRLGLVSDPDRKGYNINIWQWNNFDKGFIESYEFDAGTGYANRYTNVFFNRSLFGYIGAQNRRGYGVDLSYSSGQRQESAEEDRFHDHTYDIGFSWNNKTLFQRGRIGVSNGTQAGETYRFFSAHQGVPLRRGLSVDAGYERQTFGAERANRLIVTGTYRLDGNRALSGRLIQTRGKAPENTSIPTGTNFYIGYSQRMPRGADIYFLMGDPNADKTRNQITLKLLHPL